MKPQHLKFHGVQKDGTKRCSRCDTVKPRSGFYKASGRYDGLQGLCKPCTNEAKYESMRKKPEYYRAQGRKHNKARRLNSPDAIKREKRRDYERNRDRYARSRQAWFDAHPGAREKMHRMDRMRRRAREAAAYVEDVEPIVVWSRDDGTCYICGDQVSFYEMHLDHVTPIVKGGMHSYNNIKATHPDCNQWKHARLLSELPDLGVSGSAPPEDEI